MPTLIDSLIVRLGLDSSQLVATSGPASKKLKELEGATGATEKGVKSLNKTSKETARGVEELARSVGSFLAAIGSTLALKVFVQDAIESSAAIDRLSKNLGLGASNLTAWGNAAEEVGGSSKGLQGSLMMLSREQTNLQLTGESKLIPYFSMLGIAMVDAAGNARPATEIYLQLAKSLETIARPKAHNILSAMGVDEGMTNLLLKGRTELELTLKRQKEYGDQVAKFAPEATKLQRAIVDLKQQFTLFGLSLLQQAGPSLEKFLGMLERFATWAQANQSNITDVLKVMAIGLGAIGIALLPVDLAVIGVIALAAAIGLLWNDYKVWKEGGKSLINWGEWTKEINFVKAGIDGLVHSLEILKDTVQIVWKGLHGDSKGANALSGKLHDKVMGWMGFDKNSAPIPDSFKNMVRSSDNQIKIKSSDGNSISSELAMKYFSQFFSPQVSAGLASQIHSESNGNPNAVGDNGQAYGLIQWHPDRQANFKKMFGHDIQGSSTEEQLRFMVAELGGTESAAGRRLKQATSAQQAGEIASQFYVRPGDVQGEASKRGIFAAQLLNGVKGASATAQIAGTPQGSGGGSSNDNSVENHVTVGTINVHTQATDGIGVASDLGKSMDYLFASQANTGLN